MMVGRRSWSTLTPREIEVLKLIAAGLSTKQIAISLDITFKTAACHRCHIMDKLGIHEVANLTRYAFQNGHISLSGNGTPVPNQDDLFERIRLTYAEYKQAIRGKDKADHQNYHAAVRALKEFLLPPS